MSVVAQCARPGFHCDVPAPAPCKDSNASSHAISATPEMNCLLGPARALIAKKARSKDKIAVAMQGMFPTVRGSADMVRQWEDSVAAAAESRSGTGASGAGTTTAPDRYQAAADLERRMNAVTARKQVCETILLQVLLAETCLVWPAV